MDSTGIIEVLLIIITVAVVAGFAGVLYLLSGIYRALAGQQHGEAAATPTAQREPRSVARPAPASARPPAGIDPKSMGSLEEYLGAIGRKYDLASFTLATADGLLIGSTKPGAQDEAARYSYLYAQGKLQDETGAELLGLSHRGETVVGIARPSEPLSAELMNALEQDTRDALRHWV